MLNRTRLLLYVNVALFIYSLSEMIKILLVHNNFFTQFFNNLSSNLKSLTDRISSAITSWQSIIYLLIFVLLIFLLLKFWRVTFILLEIILALLIIDYVLLLFNIKLDLKIFYYCCNGSYTNEYLADIQRF